MQTDNGMREIEDGLQPDEWIVVDGLQLAQPGTKVQTAEQESEEKTATEKTETPRRNLHRIPNRKSKHWLYLN
ncbi:MAG: hypothetical protein R3C11_09885 [Planctomycetaceae bacterium]